MSESEDERFQWFIGSAGPEPNDYQIDQDLDVIDRRLSGIEDEVIQHTMSKLADMKASRERTASDEAFGYFTHCILFPYAEKRLASRAAWFSRAKLIPKVLEIEAARSIEFHKGALFYDTALAHLAIGDEARFEYFLAMADEEDFGTHGVEGKPRQRGTHNLRQGGLSSQTIAERVRFAADLMNGVVSTNSATFAFMFGAPITEPRVDQWRRSLDSLHHAELFRFLYEAELFCGRGMPEYCPVRDNPYVMLRLAKTLAHAGQWVESRLTALQRTLPAGTIRGSTLTKKLGDEPAFACLSTAAGNVDRFAGTNPRTTTDADAEIRQLLNDLQTQTDQDQKDWRALRLLYIIRNSTAHEIDENLAFYRDRKLLMELMQVVFLSYFVIEKRKTGRIP